MKLIVGLGNPGNKYQGTRHNIGFEIVDLLAQRHAADSGRTKFDGLVQECLIDGHRTLLLKPQTYMNLSGRSVRQAVDFYKIPSEDLLVVCDDFQLDLGTLRFRRRGSDGGQKGLADTIRQLGTDEFPRLRLGIGPVPERWNAVDFVLGKFSPAEQKLLEDERIRICNSVDAWVSQGITEAMNQFNG